MAECEVWGELTDRSGECRRFTAPARCNIRGILRGVRHLQEQLGGPLNQMVLQEKQQQQLDVERAASGSGGFGARNPACLYQEEEDDDDDDDEDSKDKPADHVDGGTPPTKRTRIQS
ncbi:uncharacterized protein si:dkeyp-55f12.3 isoform X1 [Leucoraja erinacea]|uniref:uncharacterized protein si:dkeyp-55f12.3 isoform X1 n=1 Tax=Leucoraja erinaceus TaxID=7782 RepID=UPI0024541CD2|nr:uncharacterized protein si:dkeyp-55f12.3 isoform X1 [Leucoraja erinacea]